MATKKITLEGIAHWARLSEDNRDLHGWQGAYEDMDGMYTIEVELDEDNEAKLLAAGSAKRKNKNGRYKFTRPHKHRFDWACGEPKVTLNGRPWSFEDDGPIWNGSKISIDLDVYETSGMNGTRMTAVEVLELADAPRKEEEEEDISF